MSKIKFGKCSQIKPGESVEKRILARRIAIFNDNGNFYAIEADCKHMKAPLTTGDAKDGIITCKWHQWKYELHTGKCLTHPGMDLRKFEIEIEDDDLYVIFGS